MLFDKKIYVTVVLSFFISLQGCVSKDDRKEPISPISDLTKEPIIKQFYNSQREASLIIDSEFGAHGIYSNSSSESKSLDDSRLFNLICSYHNDYLSSANLPKDFVDLISNFQELPPSTQTSLREGVIGIFSDDYYCGSVIQLAFPLENALEKLDAGKFCIDRMSKFGTTSNLYKVLFFDYVHNSPRSLEGHHKISSVISESITSGKLCEI